MAKNKKTNKPSRPRPRRQRKLAMTKSGGMNVDVGTSSRIVSDYAQLLVDPCAGPLGAKAYPGPQGFGQRFVNDMTLNAGVGLTAGIFAYYPAVNAFVSNAVAAPTTTFTPAWTVGSIASPGHAFLSTAASKSRCHAACITAVPASLSITSITGEWAYGCFSPDELLSLGANTTVDAIFALCNARSIVQRATLEVKWSPGLRDNQFTTYGTLASGDTSDQNCIILAWRGVPAATAIGVRLTSVLEWCPKAAQGIQSDATSSAPGINHVRVAAALHEHKPTWWHGVVDNFQKDVSVAARYVGQAGLSKAAEYAISKIGYKTLPDMLGYAAPLALTL